MKTALQTLTAAVAAFNLEIYKNTARHAVRLDVHVDDHLFDRIALDNRVDPDSVLRGVADLTIDEISVRVHRATDLTTARETTRAMRRGARR